MTNIIIHDTLSLLEPLFTSRDHPKVIFQQAQDSILQSTGLVGQISAYLEPTSQSGYDVLMAANQGVISGQQGFGLFNPSRDRNISEWQFKRFADLDIFSLLHDSLTEIVSQLSIGDVLPQIECLLVPTDPANRMMMSFNHGLGVFGGVAGKIIVQLFPDDGNLKRLKPALIRAVIQNIRQAYMKMNGIQTLVDWLVTEGLAILHIADQCPDIEQAWNVVWRKPQDWDQTLCFVADHHGLEKYDDLVTNIYGSPVPIGSVRAPIPTNLDDDEREYTLEIIKVYEETIPHKIAAYLFGDELIAPQGYPPEGLSPYAGIYIAEQMIRVSLQNRNIDIHSAIRQSTETIIDLPC